MRKFIVCMSLLAMMPCISVADSARVQELITLKQSKMETLKKCKGTTKNLKIAGLSTLGITTVGVGVNIAEAVILDKKKKELADEQAKSKEAGFKYNCEQLKPSKYDEKTKTCTLERETGTLNDKDNEFIKDFTCEENGDTKTCIKDEFKIVVKKASKTPETRKESASAVNGSDEEIIGKSLSLDQQFCFYFQKGHNEAMLKDTDKCNNMQEGTWWVNVNEEIVDGTAKCSITQGNHAEIGNPSDTSGKYCWCKTQNNWVNFNNNTLTNATDATSCLIGCSGFCMSRYAYFSSEYDPNFQKALDAPVQQEKEEDKQDLQLTEEMKEKEVKYLCDELYGNADSVFSYEFKKEEKKCVFTFHETRVLKASDVKEFLYKLDSIVRPYSKKWDGNGFGKEDSYLYDDDPRFVAPKLFYGDKNYIGMRVPMMEPWSIEFRGIKIVEATDKLEYLKDTLIKVIPNEQTPNSVSSKNQESNKLQGKVFDFKVFDLMGKCHTLYEDSGVIAVKGGANCDGMKRGTWLATIGNKEYAGESKCSVTGGKIGSSWGNPADAEGKNCGCQDGKIIPSWEFVHEYMNTNECLVACASVCAVSSLNNIGFYEQKYNKK